VRRCRVARKPRTVEYDDPQSGTGEQGGERGPGTPSADYRDIDPIHQRPPQPRI
jgi:hypothetical protein